MKGKSALTRNIVILTAVIAVLIGLVVWVVNIDDDKTDESAATPIPSYTAYSVDTDDIDGIVIDNGGAVLTVSRTADKWTINDLQPEEVSAAKIESLISNTLVMKSSIEITAGTAALAEYGLEAPDTKITVNRKDGSADVMYIGDLSPVTGEYFLKLDGTDKVYSIYAYKVDSIRQDVSYYRSFNRFSIDTKSVNEIKLERRQQPDIHLKVKDVIDETSYNVWTVTEPYKGTLSAIDQYVDDKILAPLSQLQISEIAPSGIDYGFDNPNGAATVVLAEYNEDGSVASTSEQRLTIGKTENNMSYVKLSGSDNVYIVEAAALDFVFVDEFLVVSKLQGMADIAYTSKVTVEADGRTSVMEIGHPEKSKFTFKINGTEADEKLSKQAYQEIIAVSVDGVYNGETLGASEVTVTFTGYDGAADTVVEYIPINELSYAVRRNGETQFTIKKLTIEKMLEKLSEYEKNPVK